MVEFEAGDAAELAAELGFWQGGAQGGGVHESQVQEKVLPLLDRIIAFAKRHELYALRTIREQRKAIVGGSRDRALSFALQESSALFSRSLKDSIVWRMTHAEVMLSPIQVPEAFGEAAVEDGLEAVQCYAASRYTAAGFHAMRLAERLARALIPKARIPPKKFYPSIDAIVSEIEKKLRAEEQRRRDRGKNPPTGKKRGIGQPHYVWLSQVVLTFRSVKDGWRNPIGHYDTCDAPKAMELVNVARALMRQFGETV
jgi:hypothetical protein